MTIARKRTRPKTTFKAWMLYIPSLGDYMGNTDEPPFLYPSKRDALDAHWENTVPVRVTIKVHLSNGR